jgi:hypothetical protein
VRKLFADDMDTGSHFGRDIRKVHIRQILLEKKLIINGSRHHG